MSYQLDPPLSQQLYSGARVFPIEYEAGCDSEPFWLVWTQEKSLQLETYTASSIVYPLA
jgi:hypothetical protein